MDQDLPPPPGESPYDNAGDVPAVGRNTEEYAYDNSTYEMDTGEQTAVDMLPPDESVNDIANDPESDVVNPGNDFDVDAEGEVAVDEDTEPSAVIEVNAVDADADVDPKDEIEMVRLDDGDELPEYTEPAEEQAGPLPSKSRVDSRIYESIKKTPAGPSAGSESEEEKLRRQKSLKICIFLFILVLIGVIVGLVAFYIVYSVGLAAATLPSPSTTAATAVTEPPLPIQIDNVAVELNLTFNDKNFTDALYDSNSTEYKELEAEILMLLAGVLQSGNFSTSTMVVLEFSPGSVVVTILITIDSVPVRFNAILAEDGSIALGNAIAEELVTLTSEGLSNNNVDVVLSDVAVQEVTTTTTTVSTAAPTAGTTPAPTSTTGATDTTTAQATPPANSTCYDCESAFLCVKDPEWICDGSSDCTNGEDEMNCPASCFECQTHPKYDNCIDFGSVCDGEIDCFNGTDELDCDASPLPCVSCDSAYPCVHESWVCDREEECYNGEDELNCVPGNSSCFFCENSGDCVPWEYVCDGEYDCYDTSDEKNCNTTSDPACFPCYADSCVQIEWVCDGDIDCRDGSDERDCNSTGPPCFQCATDAYNCIDPDYVCDQYTNCDDGSDEWNCISTAAPTAGTPAPTSTTGATDTTTAQVTCASDEFTCVAEGTCIENTQLCDFIPDCRVSRADETEDLCKVSSLTVEQVVSLRRNNTWTTPASYPARGGTVETPLDYILYQLSVTGSSAINSHMLINLVFVEFTGVNPSLLIGRGHDPVQALYDNDGPLLGVEGGIWPNASLSITTPDNEAYILLRKAPGDNVEINIKLSAFQCFPEGAIACKRLAECYLESEACDGVEQCPGGDDEDGCSTPDDCHNCTTAWAENTCLPSKWVCDGTQDCLDNSDENDCPTCFECESDFGCVVDPDWVCDRVKDCSKGEDEMNCTATIFPCFECESDFACILDPYWVCDGEDDCYNGEDEMNCTVTPPTNSTCFDCASGYCVFDEWVCDGDDDCFKGEDELNCETKCFECESDYCVFHEWVCDGEDDCNNGEDELNCTEVCPVTSFACPEPDSTCIEETLLCDFIPHCNASGSDETEDLCMVSQISEDISVPFDEYRWLMTPVAYPSRDIDTPKDYLLYRASSPPNSHLLIEIIKVVFDGDDSSLTIGTGLDPVQAFYDDGILLGFSRYYIWNSTVPFRGSTPGNEAYILLERAPGGNVNFTLRLSSFQCMREDDIPCSYSNDCYQESEICDGVVQCELSQEDETDCTTPPANSSCFECESDFACITDPDWVCDRVKDCSKGEDEMNCTATIFPCFECESDFACILDPYWVCDGDDDCYNGEDESNCTITPPTNSTCFDCASGYCVFDEWVCDGEDDCFKGEDELNCETKCFECASDYCVFHKWVCDGEDDCINGEDELNCTEVCPVTSFACPEPDSTCIEETLLCDFIPHCRASGSDETEELCMVSQISEDISVPFDEYRWLMTPDAYPSRDIDTPNDYLLYRASSPPNSHLLIEIIKVVFDGDDSTLTVGTGHDPVQAFYNDGLLLGFSHYFIWNNTVPFRASTPGNEVYILLERAPGGNVNISMRLSSFQCVREDDIPCPYSNDCYQESEICDGVVQCTLSQEDEIDCTNSTCYECESAFLCVKDPEWVCDGVDDCYNGEDEFNCTVTCVECDSDWSCVRESWVCDGFADCYNGEDESGCNVTCVECDSDWSCVRESWVCDGLADCYNGEDESGCNDCGEDEYLCFFDDTTCFNASGVCDGIYDCPSGVDEYNCTGCLACSNTSTCLVGLQVCNFFNDCPGGEDETEGLCNHSQFIKNVDIQTGEWQLFSEGYVSERILDDRDTPASNIYDFTHYSFNSDPGTTLYIEIQNLTVSLDLSGLLVSLVRISFGSGADPTDINATRGYVDGYGNVASISDSMNFSLTNNTGFLLIAIPKTVVGIFNIIFRVTAIECVGLEVACNGSPHCYSWLYDRCDGEIQCLDSQEDEYGCEAGNSSCFFCENSGDCVPWEYVCDGEYDCYDTSDEKNCNTTSDPGCFPCYADSCVQIEWVCDGEADCRDGSDERGCNSTGLPCFQCATDAYHCIDLDFVCDEETDCDDGSDEWNCTYCFECPSHPDYNNCLKWDFVCDGEIDCFDGTDELDCDASPLPCIQCDSPWPCVPESWVCDGGADCYNGEDEAGCNNCGEDEYPCFLDDTTCFSASDVCDGIYDCPSGADEFNCTGCFACGNTSTCLSDLQVCNFLNDCPEGEDETEGLCNHSQFIKNVDIQTGEWQLFSEGYVSERILDDRDTPASDFYDFTHYGFNSDPGTTLYMEIQNLTVSLSGPSVPLVRISFGSGADPTYLDATRGYVDGYGNVASISDSLNFSLTNNTGFLLIAIPKTVVGIFNIIFRVTAIECGLAELACTGSPHCYNWFYDRCDGEIECLDSQEDEFGCEPTCFECQTHPSYDNCIHFGSVCDGEIDCFNGTDELDCDVTPLPCVQCDSDWPCVRESWVCDRDEDCYNGEDELNCVPGNSSCFFCENSGDCVPWDWVCDGAYDCYDTSDEKNCNTTSDPACFPCYSYYCVELEYVCDGDADCRDGSDERDCNSTGLPCFECATDAYNCIDLDFVCDEGTDCDDGSDEWNCTRCELNEFRCNGDGECIGSEFVCNLAQECTLAEDEKSCGYDDISTEVWVVASEWYNVTTIELQPVGDNINAALWHFFAPDSSYILFFDVSSSYALPVDSEAVFGEGTDFLGSSTAIYFSWGSITKFNRHDFFVLSHEAFVAVKVPVTESAPVTLSFSVRAVMAPECTGDSSVCVACAPDFENCDLALDCSQLTEYICP